MANDLVLTAASRNAHPLGHPDSYTPGPTVIQPNRPRVRGPWDGASSSSRRGLLRDFAAFLRLLRAWAQGRYARFPVRSAFLLACATLYVVSPIDAIPDFIPFVGIIDDAAVLALVLRALRKDVAPFVDWESLHA